MRRWSNQESSEGIDIMAMYIDGSHSTDSTWWKALNLCFHVGGDTVDHFLSLQLTTYLLSKTVFREQRWIQRWKQSSPWTMHSFWLWRETVVPDSQEVGIYFIWAKFGNSVRRHDHLPNRAKQKDWFHSQSNFTLNKFNGSPLLGHLPSLYLIRYLTYLWSANPTDPFKVLSLLIGN